MHLYAQDHTGRTITRSEPTKRTITLCTKFRMRVSVRGTAVLKCPYSPVVQS